MSRPKVVDHRPPTGASGSTILGNSSSRKRAKTDSAMTRRSRKNGKLGLLLQMPIEIFTEVACYMELSDLLSLARTSLGLRQILMSKSSRRIWEAVRLTHGIPECPMDLSEPQYADLLFGKGCKFCLDARVKKTYFALRIRACKTCFEEQTLEQKQIDKEFMDAKRVFDPTMIPWVEAIYRNHLSKRFLASQVQKVMRKTEELSENPIELQGYITERQNFTRDVLKSVGPIEKWIRNAYWDKAHKNYQIMEERHLRDYGISVSMATTSTIALTRKTGNGNNS
ncbi:hypothetical protein SCHPADRAFT_120423 [Schizopora paradoxa]|uniref:F-box domain-containing protein n=1 Tax=Schizopora paradoxa TaxID=27342 RepID=A0A0H2S3F9_9AGAM|nr:hypothetical protein SCHPADRAFT_120423 [Schizopora paradoxa]